MCLQKITQEEGRKFCLDHELVNGPLDGRNETRQLLVFIRCDAGRDDRPGNTAGPTQSCLRSHEDVRDVLAIERSDPQGRCKPQINIPSLRTTGGGGGGSPKARYRL